MSPGHTSKDVPEVGRRRSWGAETGATTLDEVLTLDQHQSNEDSAPRSDIPRYPGSDDSEYITWARWDALLAKGAGSAR